jgi:hypothetical protein
VIVTVPPVVLLAAVSLKSPASASESSVAFAQVLFVSLVSPTATAINPPLLAIVIDPVVSGSVESMSEETSEPLLEYEPPYTA